MKQQLIILLSFSLLGYTMAAAQGNRGGWMEYRYLYDAPNLYHPEVMERYFTVGVHFYNSGTRDTLRIYNAYNGERIYNRSIQPIDNTRSSIYTTHFFTCPATRPLNDVCRELVIDVPVTVPVNPNGYLFSSSSNIRDLANVNIDNPRYAGLLNVITAPGIINGVDYHTNSSPVLDFNDTVIVCRNTPFTYQVIASDPNGDSLSFSLGDAITSPADTTSPPLTPVFYFGNFSGTDPLGTPIFLNPVTGLLTGTAPDGAGRYAVAIYVKEWRNGVLLSTTKKEFDIRVTSCPFQKPLLKPVYSQCRVNTFTFQNEPACPAITSWFWDFGDPNTLADTSLQAVPTYTYPGVGNYTLKLKIKGANGFIDSATASVKVLDSITVSLRTDTAVCKTDRITLNPVSDGASYTWQESGGGNTLNNYIIKNPQALPTADHTTYSVVAQLNACRASGAITVNASPYPTVKTSPDTAICVGNSIGISGAVQAAYYNWSPVNTLTNSTTLMPTAAPTVTSAYVLAVRDTFYCPKTVRDTTVVRVIQQFKADAGRDTSVVVGQPLQLNASSPGTTYLLQYNWQPGSYLNNNTIQNPVAIFPSGTPDVFRYTVKATTREGCSSTDDIAITIYKTGPDILVPSAFTPNGDGRNDVLKPVLLGIRKLDYFAVYNRYGQLVFTTSEAGRGWNGTINNNSGQPTETFVYMTQGIDYTGKKIFRKGTVILLH